MFSMVFSAESQANFMICVAAAIEPCQRYILAHNSAFSLDKAFVMMKMDSCLHYKCLHLFFFFNLILCFFRELVYATLDNLSRKLQYTTRSKVKFITYLYCLFL